MTLNPQLLSSDIHRNHHGRGLSSLRLYLEDGISWGHRFRIFVRKDEDSLARQ